MKKIIVFATFFFLSCFLQAQNKAPYRIFDKNGKETSYEKLLKASEKTEIVLFGEYHNNALIHWLELEFSKDMIKKRELILGAEMLESDNQKQLNQYLFGEISQKKLDSTARLWPNYKTDYKPLVDFAKENRLSFIATNVPRRYASLVYKKDWKALDSLSLEEKSWIAPLPIKFDINLPGYSSMLGMQGGKAGDKMPKAQAIKDATMAYFILKNRKVNQLFIHYNGTYHSDNFEGIGWYLKSQNKDCKIVSIATVEQKEIDKLEKENLQKADFIIVVYENFTKTY